MISSERLTLVTNLKDPLFNQTFSPNPVPLEPTPSQEDFPEMFPRKGGGSPTLFKSRLGMALIGVFLVSVPVFIQAPLVREIPTLTLALTGLGLLLSWQWLNRPDQEPWGDLLLGFTWTWFTGGIYWGWFRTEPLFHLPIEACLLPFALWGIRRGWGLLGNWFYLGSLLGTAITDGYFYLTGLISHWRQLMQAEPHFIPLIFQKAILVIETPWGISWAIFLLGGLVMVGGWALGTKKPHYWVFSGAVLGTILVDGLFFLAAWKA